MMKLVFCVVAALAVVCVADDGTQAPTTLTPAQILAQVQGESTMAQAYLDLILRFQRATAWSSAGSGIFQLSYEKSDGPVKRFGSFEEQNLLEEEGDNDEDNEDEPALEADDEDEDAVEPELSEDNDDDEDFSLLELGSTRRFEELGDHATLFVKVGADGKTSEEKAKLSLLATYNLYSGIKFLLYQSIYQAHDVNFQFWINRYQQLTAQALGDAAPAELLQYIYLKSYSTQVRTLKLSYQLQTVSHFTMWLEDEIDVHSVFAQGPNPYANIVASDQRDAIINDKVFAFNAYSTYTLLDMQLVYLDMYLSYLENNAIGNTTNTAFVEEESEAKFVSPVNYSYYFQIMRMYQTFLQYTGAQAAQSSIVAEKQAIDKEFDNDPSNDAQGAEQRRFAQQAFGSYGMNLMYSSQIEMWMCMFDMYTMYSSMYGTQQARN